MFMRDALTQGWLSAKTAVEETTTVWIEPHPISFVARGHAVHMRQTVAFLVDQYTVTIRSSQCKHGQMIDIVNLS